MFWGWSHASMHKEKLRSTLLRLIEVGQIARAALLVPLVERGLEPGDEVLLATLAAEPDLPLEALAGPDGGDGRIARLKTRDLLEIDAGLLRLTERGRRVYDALEKSWAELETGLLADLDHKRLKALRKSLRAVDDALRGGRPH